MSAESGIQIIASMCVSVLLVGCADMQVLNQLADEFQVSSRPRADYLNEKCPRQEANFSWTNDCLEWRKARDAAAAKKRQAEAAVRKAAQEAEVAAYREQQEQKLREAQEREVAAVRADEREGYKHLSFEDFALDAAKMQGTKVALYGVYVGRGQRLASNQLAALMWTERGHSTKGSMIPLATADAARESRALLLHCDASPIGCTLVVRGRVRMLTLRNAFGTDSHELGVVVESVR